MSDKPIAVGDLVMVVRDTACGCYYGRVYPVIAIEAVAMGAVRCGHCNDLRYCDKHLAALLRGPNRDGHLPISWLKRLDPDALRDDVPTEEGIHA